MRYGTGGYSDGHGIQSCGHALADRSALGKYYGDRAWGKGLQQDGRGFGELASGQPPLSRIRKMHDQGVVAGASFGDKNFIYGSFVRRIRGQPKNGFRGNGDELPIAEASGCIDFGFEAYRFHGLLVSERLRWAIFVRLVAAAILDSARVKSLDSQACFGRG